MIGTSAALTKFKTTGSMRHCFIPLGKQNIASLQLEKDNERNETKTDVFFGKKINFRNLKKKYIPSSLFEFLSKQHCSWKKSIVLEIKRALRAHIFSFYFES